MQMTIEKKDYDALVKNILEIETSVDQLKAQLEGKRAVFPDDVTLLITENRKVRSLLTFANQEISRLRSLLSIVSDQKEELSRIAKEQTERANRAEAKLREAQSVNVQDVTKNMRKAVNEAEFHTSSDDATISEDELFFEQYGRMGIRGYISPRQTGCVTIHQLFRAFEMRFRRRNTPTDENGNPGNWEVTPDDANT